VPVADFYSFAALWHAYRACRRNKRNTLNALAFDVDAEAQLLELQRQLRDHTYQPGQSICFVTDGPKPREVFAADFRDRIAHHLLVARLEAIFEPRFIHDSYACRPGKGVLAASDRLMRFLRQATANGRRPAWALKLDVASFFPSIHKPTLNRIICAHVRDPELRWLTQVILFHDPTSDYRFKPGPRRVPHPRSPHYPVPPVKSLFGKDNERGLPIGNLTSQFWANVYLSELDQFVKRALRCRLYVRYVDDLVLLAENPHRLAGDAERIEAFLQARLKLTLRADTGPPFTVGRGVVFVGWKTWWDHRVPRRQTLANLAQRVRRFEHDAVTDVAAVGGQRVVLGHLRARRQVHDLHAALASYSGHLRHGAAFTQWSDLWEMHPVLGALFAPQGWALRWRYPERRVARARSFRTQYAALLCQAGPALLFCQVGRFIEFRGPQRPRAERVLELRRVYLPRAGFALAAGFPVAQRVEYLQRALRAGEVVVETTQARLCFAASRSRDRRVASVWVPSG